MAGGKAKVMLVILFRQNNWEMGGGWAEGKRESYRGVPKKGVQHSRAPSTIC